MYEERTYYLVFELVLILINFLSRYNFLAPTTTYFPFLEFSHEKMQKLA